MCCRGWWDRNGPVDPNSRFRSRRDEVDPELFDTLASFADFILFKETMLNYKSQRDGEMGEFPTLVVTSLACGLPKS